MKEFNDIKACGLLPASRSGHAMTIMVFAHLLRPRLPPNLTSSPFYQPEQFHKLLLTDKQTDRHRDRWTNPYKEVPWYTSDVPGYTMGYLWYL